MLETYFIFIFINWLSLVLFNLKIIPYSSNYVYIVKKTYIVFFVDIFLFCDQKCISLTKSKYKVLKMFEVTK